MLPNFKPKNMPQALTVDICHFNNSKQHNYPQAQWLTCEVASTPSFLLEERA